MVFTAGWHRFDAATCIAIFIYFDSTASKVFSCKALSLQYLECGLTALGEPRFSSTLFFKISGIPDWRMWRHLVGRMEGVISKATMAP